MPRATPHWLHLAAIAPLFAVASCSSNEEKTPAANPDAALIEDAALAIDSKDPVGNLDGGDASCLAQTQKASVVPVDMYLMLDRSGSMAEAAGASTLTKWKAVSQAVEKFSKDPRSAPLSLGMQYFPLLAGPTKACPNGDECGTDGSCLHDIGNQNWCYDRCSDADPCAGSECKKATAIDTVCTNVTCLAGSYSVPEIPTKSMAEASPLIVASMAGLQPFGGTPTLPALQGAIAFARDRAGAMKGRRQVVVLATDGLPTLCPADADSTPAKQAAVVQQVIDEATKGVKGKPAVTTFVIGVETDGIDSQAILDGIAAAGGTGKAAMVDLDGDVGEQFLAALERVRSSMSCEVEIPAPDAGDLNYMRVNVEVGTGTSTILLDYVGSLDQCAANKGGWYYDADPAVDAPERIVLCPTSCEELQGSETAKVDIAIGCATRVPAPK